MTISWQIALSLKVAISGQLLPDVEGFQFPVVTFERNHFEETIVES